MNPYDEQDDHACRQAELLAWVLDPERRASTSREELVGDEDTAAELAELERFVADCRASLSSEQLGTARPGLVEDVLASTTREDLSLRGDLHLFGRFVAQNLRTSVLLRVVAASFLLHVLALPVVAYLAYFQPREHETLITLSLPPAALPFEAAAEEPEPVVQEPELDTDLLVLPSAGELFADRLAAQGIANLEGFSEPPYEQVTWGDDLGLVLWAEHKLDDAARGAESDERLLRFALQNLSELLRSTDQRETGEPVARLARSAWLRAERGGWLEQLPPADRIASNDLAAAEELAGDAWAEVYLEAAGKDY